METKYGKLPDELLVTYVDGMVAMVYKMMPMKENRVTTLPSYIESTLRELIGNKDLVFALKDRKEFLSILGTMESLLIQDDFYKFRSDVFKIINIIKRLKLNLGGEDE
jgi:hypothetical protein